jgi:hypothetical protein
MLQVLELMVLEAGEFWILSEVLLVVRLVRRVTI